MQTATDGHTRPGKFRPFGREHLAAELVVVAAIMLTVLGFGFRDTLTRRELSFTPDAQGRTFLGYQYDDKTNGGTSTIGFDSERPLTWTCNLTLAYEYGYCGFGLLFDPAGPS